MDSASECTSTSHNDSRDEEDEVSNCEHNDLSDDDMSRPNHDYVDNGTGSPASLLYHDSGDDDALQSDLADCIDSPVCFAGEAPADEKDFISIASCFTPGTNFESGSDNDDDMEERSALREDIGAEDEYSIHSLGVNSDDDLSAGSRVSEVSLDTGNNEGANIHDSTYSGRLSAVGVFLRAMSGLAVALYIWAVIARVSTANMCLLFRILHAQIPGAMAAADLPRDYCTTKRTMDKARMIYRGPERGFEEVKIEIREEALVSRRIKSLSVMRRPIRDCVLKICRNSDNPPGSLRSTCSVLDEGIIAGDIMSSPLVHEIYYLAMKLFVAKNIPENQRLPLFVMVSGDGTAINRGASSDL